MTSSAHAPGASLRSLFPDVCFRKEWGEGAFSFSHFTLYWFRILHSQHTNFNTSRKHMHKNMQVCGVTHITDTDMLQSYNSYYCIYRSFFKANFNINCNTTNLHNDLNGCHIGEKIKLAGSAFHHVKTPVQSMKTKQKTWKRPSVSNLNGPWSAGPGAQSQAIY